MATGNVQIASSTQICTWCQAPVSFYNTTHCARTCTGCISTQIYCVSCTNKECTMPVCLKHVTCWQNHVNPLPTHARVAHQIVDPFSSLFVDAVTYSEKDNSKLQHLHERDELARWFSVNLDEETPKLWLYDRFTRLCDPDRTGNTTTDNHYPTFVSFIGNTSAGKSTIVRAMLLLGLLKSVADISSAESIQIVNDARTGKLQMPVTRSGNIDHMTDPTTFGVHLYSDSSRKADVLENSQGMSRRDGTSITTTVRYPLLFADCEGFGAGTAVTNAMRFADSKDFDNATVGVIKLPITSPSYNSKGKDGIDLFYARTLYAISDVIVFVTKIDQSITADLTRLLEWASAAVRKSFNQPSRKTLIIVQNMERQFSDSEEYSAARLEKLYLHSFGDKKVWSESHILRSFVEDYNRMVRDELVIKDNEQLYDALFQKIRCCYIPDKDISGSSSSPQSQKVYHHFGLLRDEIESAADEEQQLRAGGFAQYNVPTMSHVLSRVFEHFRTSEDPLNFYLAARRDNPTPCNVSGHVANFLRLVFEHTNYNVAQIEDMIISAISLTFIIYVKRTFLHPSTLNPSDMFEHDLKDIWKSGLDKYLLEYERCTYRFLIKDGDKVRCSVRGRYGHKMHVSEKTSTTASSKKAIEAKGDFRHLRSWSEADKEEWVSGIKRRFEQMYAKAFAHHTDTSLTSQQVVQDLRQQTYRAHHFVWSQLQSNKTCLSCCQSVPDHVLPCGHSYCPRCVQEIAKPSRSFECAFDMSLCFLCCGNHIHNTPHQIQLKPRCAGVRILALDGGGIRGIVELALVQAIEREINLNLQISELFDLVVGTSTGGIVALSLVMSKDSTISMVNFFEAAAKATFSRTRATFKALTKGLMLFGRYDSQYDSAPLESNLKSLFGDETILFAPAKARHFQSTTRVAVTTARDRGETECLVTNYNRPQGDWTRFEREDDAVKDMKIWEAALATSAAPFYLPAFLKQPGNVDYVDGAVYANCPAKIAMEEKDKLWPNDGASLDILLSLGTGNQSKERPKIPTTIKYSAFAPLFKMFERQMNAKKAWDDLEGRSPAIIKSRLHRLNPDIRGEKGDYVNIDHHWELRNLMHTVDDWSRTNGAENIRYIGHALIASLFFFEPEQNNAFKQQEIIAGSIRCRLQHESEALRALLANKVVGFWHTTISKLEVANLGTLFESRWRSIKDLNGVVERPDLMIIKEGNTRKFRLEFQISAPPSGNFYEVIAVQLKNATHRIPISGFPATTEELNERSGSKWLQ